MSFKKNLIANYASQIYMTLAGIIILPLYLKYMGAEAYGLVGFFAALQSWFNILDLGLSPSIARETARMRAGALSIRDYRELLRALQLIFFFVMLLGAGTLFLLAPYIARFWLNVQTLPLHEVQTALRLMAASVALRWMCSLYRATITGSERFIWLSFYTWIFTTLRYLGVLLVFTYVGTTPLLFFQYQIIISVFELVFLAIKAIKEFPALPKNALSWSMTTLITSLRRILPFALSISVTSSILIVITQTDKLILSKLLSLTEYGYFTLGVLGAHGVMLFSAPFSMVLLPRMAKLRAEGNNDKMMRLYRQATQFVAAIAIPASVVLAFFPKEVLWLWTNNLAVAQEAAPVLRLYALGNAALAFATFPYYLQYAYGNLRLHVIGNSCFAVTLIPAIIWATKQYGMIGAAWVWLLANLSFFTIWTTFVHNRLVKQLHWSWLLHDIVPPACISVLAVGILNYCFNETDSKLWLVAEIGLIATLTVCCNLLFIKFSTLLTLLKNIKTLFPRISLS